MARARTRSNQGASPTPLLATGKPVDWWFIFKFNSAEEPGNPVPRGTKGIFDVRGWKRPEYEKDDKKHSQHYICASSDNPNLVHDKNILGTSTKDPLGATFDQVYNGSYYYVLWNDQFYDDPIASKGGPWGHSKGMLAWNDAGEGFVMQVSTPSWPASGNKKYPRQTDGNTLGSVTDDDIEVSQHFFALKLTEPDVVKVLVAMSNACVVTGVSDSSVMNQKIASANSKINAKIKKRLKDTKNPPTQAEIKALKRQLKKEVKPAPPPPNIKQVINNGGPDHIQHLVSSLGNKPGHGKVLKLELSSGATLISKPANVAVPPWQLVSAKLGGINLRVASWWANPKIFSTTPRSPIPKCWDDQLGKPGAVDIATTGKWNTQDHKVENLCLEGGMGANHNHAKFGVSTSGSTHYSIFGDMNQQGALWPGYDRPTQKCSSSQNGRGGMFFALQDKTLHKSISSLIEGKSAPSSKPQD